MARKDLYSRLKRLFANNVVVRNVGGKKLRVVDADALQSFTTNAMRDRYSRIMSSTSYSSPFSGQYGMNMAFQTQRIMLFRDYSTMDTDPILSSALDIFADQSTTTNEFGKILVIESDDMRVKDILENLFYDILNINFNLYWWTRGMVKFGDFFLFLEISEKYGVINCIPLSPYDTIRMEGQEIEHPFKVTFETLGANGTKQKFENYEIAHFRLLSDGEYLPYGKSQIEPARRIWRQLVLMEDSMMIHRIMRAPEKRIFKIDIGNMPPADVDPAIEKIMARSKKIPFIDPQSGEYNLRYNMQNIIEDFYIPVRGGDSGTEITNLPGLQYNAIEDIHYLLNKLFAALKIPKAFFGYDENMNGKLTLAAEDVRFSQTITRIQKTIISELKKIAMVHLYSLGFTDESLVNFDLHLTSPSTIYEQEKINLWTEKINLATSMMATKMFSTDFIYKEIFKMPPEEYATQRDAIVFDTKRNFRITAIEGGQPDPQKFGYPQDQEPQPEGAEGGEAGQPPQATAAGVDSLPELPQQEEGQENESNEEVSKMGRPEKGPTYGQDSHPRGRDPLGMKGRYRALHRGDARSSGSPLSLETQTMLSGINRKIEDSGKLLNENSELDGTYMDDKLL